MDQALGFSIGSITITIMELEGTHSRKKGYNRWEKYALALHGFCV